MDERDLIELERIVNNLVRDLVQLRQDVAALRSAYAGHMHQENGAAAYTQNATTAGPSAAGPAIASVHSDYV